MASPRQSVTFTIPNNLTATERSRIGEAMVNFIISRTSRGLDKNNRPFKQYSQNYIKSQEFRVANKSPFPANLKLTGELHNDLKVLRHGSGFITVGYDDETANDKAFFAKQVRNGRREFLGMSQSDVDRLVVENRNSPDLGGEEVDPELVDEILRRIIGRS